MICDNCKKERLFTDFINNQKYCYQCTYRMKLEKSTGNRVIKPQSCRSCKKEIFNNKSQKKRQRTVFCSLKCAQEGHRYQLNNHWTRQIPNVDIN